MRTARRAAGDLALLGAAWLCVEPLAAQAPAGTDTGSELQLEVSREALAAGCPEPAWFQQRVAFHAGAAAPVGQFQVALGRDGDAWHATIRRTEPGAPDGSAAQVTERTLTDRSSACEPLAEAVALTVAILAAPPAAAAQSQPVPAASPSGGGGVQPAGSVAAATAVPDAEPDAPDAQPGDPLALWIGGGGGAAMSFISPAAPMLGLSVAMDLGHFRGGLRLLYATKQTFELDPGSIAVQAFIGTLLGCFATGPERFAVALCATADLGLLHGNASGFDQEEPRMRPYQAFGLEVQPSLRFGRSFRLSLGLAALLPVRQESFSVTGRGIAYSPPPLNFRALLFAEIGVY